jgi:hypothetical protein
VYGDVVNNQVRSRFTDSSPKLETDLFNDVDASRIFVISALVGGHVVNSVHVPPITTEYKLLRREDMRLVLQLNRRMTC